MQWHWGNIGSALAGASTVLIAVGAFIRSPAALRDWRARQRAEAEAAREQAETIRLERQRHLSGWSAHGVATFGVALITDESELSRAAHSLAGDYRGHPSPYVVLRVTESGGAGDLNRAHDLRQVIQQEGCISRPPTAGEIEALRKGLDAMEIPRAAY